MSVYSQPWKVETWNSLAGQPGLLVEFLVNGTPCLKNKHKTKQKPNGTRNHQVCPLAPTCVCTYTHSTNSIY